jgi:hypothetical protein
MLFTILLLHSYFYRGYAETDLKIVLFNDGVTQH